MMNNKKTLLSLWQLGMKNRYFSYHTCFLIFFERLYLIKSSFILTAKWSQKASIPPDPWPHSHSKPPPLPTSFTTVVQLLWSNNAHHHHSNSTVYMRVHFCVVRSMDFDKCITTLKELRMWHAYALRMVVSWRQLRKRRARVLLSALFLY